MTSEFREEVSWPMPLLRSMRRTPVLMRVAVAVLLERWRLRAIASPTTPPPMTICEKSAFILPLLSVTLSTPGPCEGYSRIRDFACSLKFADKIEIIMGDPVTTITETKEERKERKRLGSEKKETKSRDLKHQSKPVDEGHSREKSRKRKLDKAIKEADEEELEIDVNAPQPSSKRALRKLKKGKTLKHAPSAAKPLPQEFEDQEAESDSEHDDKEEDEVEDASDNDTKTEDGGKDGNRKSKKRKQKDAELDPEPKSRGKFGIWIGNLAFKTSSSDLKTFFTTTLPLGKGKGTDSTTAFTKIPPKGILRINLPESAKGVNKGFAYIDFESAEYQSTAIALSERILQSRNVLIKSSDSFAGRPTSTSATTAAESVKQTSILYIGNLSFDTTDSSLSEFLGGTESGIKRVRLATFEDSGKCKGFAFVDYKSVDSVSKVLGARKRYGTMDGRKLNLEYGEDRSLRRKPAPHASGHVASVNGEHGAKYEKGERRDRGQGGDEGGGDDEKKRKRDPRSIKPAAALLNAQRGSIGIQESKGEKIKF